MKCKILIKNQGEEYIRYELEPGVYSIGSSSDNLITLPMPGVEPFHAEIEISENGRVFVRDLGSQTGLRVNEEPISESTLTITSSLKIGAAVLKIEEQEIIEEMVTVYEFSSSGKAGASTLEKSNQSEESEADSWGGSFFQSLGYPFANRVYLLLAGAAILANLPIRTDDWAVDFMIFLAPWFLLVGVFFNTIYFATDNIPAKNLSIWNHLESMRDEEEDVLDEFLEQDRAFLFNSEKVKVFIMFLICLGPAMCIHTLFQGPEWKIKLYTSVASIIGALYLIIPLLALSMTHSLVTMNPLFVIRSFLRIPGAVTVMALALVGIILGNNLLGWMVWNLFNSAPLNFLVAIGIAHSFIFYYCLVVWCRMLGLMHYYYEDKLNWTTDPDEF